MRAIQIFVELEEIANKLPKGINKHGYECVKAQIENTTKLFADAYTGSDPILLLKATNRLVKLYNKLSNKNVQLDVTITSNQKAFIQSIKEISTVIPENTPVKYLNNNEPCFRALIIQLLEYFENDLSYNIYSMDYHKHFREVEVLINGLAKR